MTLLIGLMGEADLAAAGRGTDLVAAMLAPVHLVQEDGKWIDVRAQALWPRCTEPPAFARGAQIALLDPVRVFMRDMFGLSYAQTWGAPELQDDQDSVYKVTPRASVFQCAQFVQQLSEVALSDRLFSTIGTLMAETAQPCTERPGSYEMRRFDTFIVTDVHDAAAAAIHDAGGVLLRLRAWGGERPTDAALQPFISATVDVGGASLAEIRSDVLAQLRLCHVEVCDD